MSIDTRAIRSEPHVEIGALILRDAEVLTERWCRRAVEEQPTAKRVYYDVLRDQLTPLLEAMGRGLRQAGQAQPQLHVLPAGEHGEQRWDSGWSLQELVRDYQILQLVVLEHLEESLERPLRYREIMAVGVFVDDAIAASISTYVSNRDEHLHQIELARTQQLEESNRRKDEFMAMLAHELRNPLAPIQNATKVLQLSLSEPPPAVVESIGVVERQTQQLVRLVDDLLDVARIGQGRFELRKSVVDLGAVVEQAVQWSTPLVNLREQELSLSLPAAVIHLEADPARLVQILVNLLHNAAKYTHPGGHISVAAEREGEEAVIRVRDDGIGVPPEMLSRVFDLFTRVDEAKHSSPTGLGVGLALVQRLTQLHGGTVACKSAGVGGGSEFVVRLPAPSELAPPGTIETPREKLAVAPCHLVIVEDYPDARDALAALLRLLGHRVDVADNGVRGVERVLAVQPEVALIDIGLPDIDGYEVAQRLRAALGERIFLIALTGYGQTDDRRRAQDAGFDAHLVKPAEVEEIERLLHFRHRAEPGGCDGRMTEHAP